ncbi:MAG: 2-ketoisovalerate ferredoxin oxidoreductase, partial [Candidatus Diapherotrites archaeon CG11_big_fil_rev_8_21_14_0_20_37_9]
GFDGGITFKVAKLAVQSRLWYLFEIEHGVYKLNFNPANPKPVKDYLELQKRFKHLNAEQIEHIQRQANAMYDLMLERSGLAPKKE